MILESNYTSISTGHQLHLKTYLLETLDKISTGCQLISNWFQMELQDEYTLLDVWGITTNARD